MSPSDAPRYDDLRARLGEHDYRAIFEAVGFDLRGRAPDASGEITHVALPPAIKGGPDRTPSCSVNVREGLVNDHGGDFSGDVFQVVEVALGLSEPDARRWVAERIGFTGDGSALPEPRPPEPPKPEPAEPPKAALPLDRVREHSRVLLTGEGVYAQARRYLTETRGLTSETVRRYLIGLYERAGKWWLSFPLTVQDGLVVAYKDFRFDPDTGAMWRDEQGRKDVYQPKGSLATLYPLADFERDPRPAVVCEGEIDALSARQHGLNAVTGTGGASTFKREWVEVVAAKGTVYLAYDADEAGEQGRARAASLLADACVVLVCPLPPDKDVNDVAVERGARGLEALLNRAAPLAGDDPAPPEATSAWEPEGAEAEREFEVVACAVQMPKLIPALREALPDATPFQSVHLGTAWRRVLEAYQGNDLDLAAFRHRLGDEALYRALMERPLAADYARRSVSIIEQAGALREASDRRALARRLRQEAARLERSSAPLDEDRALAHRAVEAGGSRSSSDTNHVSYHAKNVRVNVEKWRRGERPDYEPSGYPGFDRAMIGYRRGKLHVFGAESGAGKSAWATGVCANVASRYARKGVPASVLPFSIEMDGEEITERAAAQLARVNVRTLKEGTATDEEYERFLKAVDEVAKVGLWINKASSPTLDYIHAEILRVDTEAPLKLVVVDYIELVDADGRFGTDEARLASISMGLRRIADETGVPVLALSQLNEWHLNQGPLYLPGYASIRASRKVQHDAYSICLWHWPAFLQQAHGLTARSTDDQTAHLGFDPTNPKKGHVLIKKGRDGGAGSTIRFNFHPEYTWFEDVDETSLLKSAPEYSAPPLPAPAPHWQDDDPEEEAPF